MLANVPAIRQAVPMREISREARNRDRVVDAKLIGCTPEYLAMNHLRMERGRALADYDLKRVDNVAVLAHGAAEVLFPIEDPIGRAVLIDKDFYVVIGVAAERTAAAAIGGSLEARQYDSDVYIPLTTFRRRIGDTVFTERAGSFEAESVQLSQITATVQEHRARSTKRPTSSARCWRNTTRRSTTAWSCPRNSCSRPRRCGPCSTCCCC